MDRREYLEQLLKEEHFNSAVNEIKQGLTESIVHSSPDEASRREQLYNQIRGIEHLLFRLVQMSKVKGNK